MAAGSAAASRTTAAPSPDPPCAGLTISGRPSRSTIRSSTATAPSSENRSCGRATQSGVGMPASRSTAFADGLSQASREARASQPTYGHVAEVEHAAQRAVLAGGAVQGDHHRVRRVGGQRGQQRHVGVPQLGLHADGAQRVEHPAAGPQRDVPLVGEATGEHQDVQLGRRRDRSRERGAAGVGHAGIMPSRDRARPEPPWPATAPAPPTGAEDPAHGDLLLHHAGQPAHALPDPLRRREARS